MSHPIIWTEGAFLTQQHFQYWESWLLEQHTKVIKALVPDAYGLVSCEFDPEGFKQQKCILKSLVWRTENGAWIIYDNQNMPLLVTSLEDRDEQMVYLNLPNNTHCSGLSGYDAGTQMAAYKAYYQEFPDRYDHTRKQEITLGIPVIKLTTQASDPQLYDCRPLVRLKRLVNTHFEIDQGFLPAAMTINGAPQLQYQINAVINRMSEKLAYLQGLIRRSREPGLNHEYHVISEACFALKEMLHHGCAQPREVYGVLIKTILNLEIFQPDVYTQAAMSELIMQAIHKLNDLLAQKVETLPNYIMLKNNKAYYSIENIKSEYLQGHGWYLGIDFSHQSQESVQKFLNQAKIGTLATLEQIIASAMPGIPFTHISRPPNKINLEEGYEYFKLDHESYYWKHVKEERSLMLSLPGFLEGNKIILDIMKD